jgi:hypothetical protein
LTKGPFNALWPVVDMNNALVSAILTGYAGFSSAADHVGPNYSVEHDISMLVPEVWCRMEIQERDPQFLIQNGFLEKVNDFVHEGRRVQASRLGYRVTSLFSDRFLGRIFELPNSVFTEELLRPEKQDIERFVEGVNAIVEAQTRVAKQYFNDGSVNAACPPLKALLHMMALNTYEGMDINDPAFRKLFTRESLVSSDWYKERLHTKQQRDIALWKRHIASLESIPSDSRNGYEQRLAGARKQLVRVSSPAYLKDLEGTLGADPFHLQMPATEAAKAAALTR